MGFPLPNEPNVTQFAYYLVAIPDAAEYRRAIKGHFGELGNARLWGEEGVTEASYVAAQAWLRAIDETWRLIEMGWPDQIYAAMDDIETILRGLKAVQDIGCCDNYDYTGGAIGGPPVVDGVGDVPQAVIDAGYATGVTDWVGYAEYKCMMSHVLFNDAYRMLNDIAALVDEDENGVISVIGGMGTLAGTLASILTVATGGTWVLAIGVFMAVAAAWELFEGILQVASEAVIPGIATAWLALEDDMVCALYFGDGTADAEARIEAAIDANFSGIEATILKQLNWSSRIRAAFSGLYGTQDLAAAAAAAGLDPDDYVCPCAADVIAEFTWDTDIQGWETNTPGGLTWDSDYQCMQLWRPNAPDRTAVINSNDINAIANTPMLAGHTYRFRTIQFYLSADDHVHNTNYGFSVLGTSKWTGDSNGLPVGAPSVFVDIDVLGLPTFLYNSANVCVFGTAGGGWGGRMNIDNFLVEIDDVTE